MIDISIHRVRHLRARYGTGEKATWMILKFITAVGEPEELAIYFSPDMAKYGERLAAAINLVTNTPDQEVP